MGNGMEFLVKMNMNESYYNHYIPDFFKEKIGCSSTLSEHLSLGSAESLDIILDTNPNTLNRLLIYRKGQFVMDGRPRRIATIEGRHGLTLQQTEGLDDALINDAQALFCAFEAYVLHNTIGIINARLASDKGYLENFNPEFFKLTDFKVEKSGK